MFYNLRSRSLAIGSIMLILVFAIASYGRIIFEDTILYGVENTKKQHNLNRIIVSIKNPLSSFEGKLYQYLISLNIKDKNDIPLYLFELQSQLENLTENAIINENKQFKKHAAHLKNQFYLLEDAFTVLSKFSRNDRYPITKIIHEKLNPTSTQFFTSIQVLTDNQFELELEPGMQNARHDIQDLRYIVAQVLSSTRLLFVTKTGIFGSNDATLKFILKNQNEYQNHLNKIVEKFEHYLNNNKDSIDLEVESAITDLINANEIRKEVVQKILTSLRSSHWRNDLFLMENTIKPILNAIQSELNLMERRLEKRSVENTLQTQQASNLLSNFLWLTTVLIIVFFLAIFFSIEKWLRIPLIKISNALHFERGQVSGNSLKTIGLKEIDHVITAFNLMQKEIKIRQQRLSYILQNIGEGIIVVDQYGDIDSFNATAEDIFKTKETDIKGKNINNLLNIDSISDDIKWLSKHQTKPNNEHLNYFLDGIQSNGDTFKCDITISHMTLNDQSYGIIIVRDATKRLINQRNLETAKDKAEQASTKLEAQVIQLDQSMTELKETQNQLIESEKNACLSGLVAGVAHEINTPIGVSVTASSLLSEEIKNLHKDIESNSITKTVLTEFIDDALEASQIIDSNLQRAADLVKSFKLVAVDQTSHETRVINLKEYIDEIVLSLRPKLKKTKHTVHNNIDTTINISTSPGALSQIFTNLIINSLIHAFTDKKEGNIFINSSLNDQTLTMTFKDDGKGMNEEHRKKVFDPFFTTKRGDGGSGLGLHIVQNITTQTLNGSISCQSDIDQGCLFELIIPV